MRCFTSKTAPSGMHRYTLRVYPPVMKVETTDLKIIFSINQTLTLIYANAIFLVENEKISSLHGILCVRS